jgi:calpain-15
MGNSQENRRSEWEKFIWLRSKEIYTKGYKIFSEGIDPNDILQGSLGDCYMLSVLSAIAEKPSRIKKIFISQSINEVGSYCVRICDMGEWNYIIIDDLFPCYSNSRKPCFTSG